MLLKQLREETMNNDNSLNMGEVLLYQTADGKT